MILRPIARFGYAAWVLLGLVGLAAAVCAANVAGALGRPAAAPPARLTVHEWGTFTVLQDEHGNALGGINIDDEELPSFVHQFGVLARPHAAALPLKIGNAPWFSLLMKGVPQRYPLVRVRLETPVIYFYPSKSTPLPLTLDLQVKFRGGWLTEYYPAATADPLGILDKNGQFNALRPDTIGSLSWEHLQIGTKGKFPATDSPVWLAPRQVDSATVSVPRENNAEESEKYLFYRGVGNFEAPLKTTQNATHSEITVRGNFQDLTAGESTTSLGTLWLLHVKADGRTAFRQMNTVRTDGDLKDVLATMPTSFEPDEYSQTNVSQLCESLHAALVADGLYDKEAQALLNTWQAAYFKSPGLRLFGLMPRFWTDRTLPLTLSETCVIERVMVARIELISPEQREILARLSALKSVDNAWVQEVWKSPNAWKFLAGRSNFGDLGVEIPAHYQAYLDLGRFRNALVLAEAAQRPSPGLDKFIAAYNLEAFRSTDAVPPAKQKW